MHQTPMNWNDDAAAEAIFMLTIYRIQQKHMIQTKKIGGSPLYDCGRKVFPIHWKYGRSIDQIQCYAPKALNRTLCMVYTI